MLVWKRKKLVGNVNLESGYGGLRQGEFVVLRDVAGDFELLQAWNGSFIFVDSFGNKPSAVRRVLKFMQKLA